jgi:hypothetical protein
MLLSPLLACARERLSLGGDLLTRTQPAGTAGSAANITLVKKLAPAHPVVLPLGVQMTPFQPLPGTERGASCSTS